MAKSVFNLNVTLIGEQESIVSISRKLLSTFYDLSLFDPLFGDLKVVAQSKGFYKPIILKSEYEGSINELAKSILDYSLPDIRSNDGIDNPDINYSRSYGFTFAINFADLITLTFRMGSDQSNGIGTISFARSISKDFDWYFAFFKNVSEGLSAIYSKVGLIETSFNQACKSYSAPLGWITYFSNSFNPEIPNDLKGIEYEHTDKGKYMILTREDFTADKETYEAYKQKLLNLMEEIKRRVPEYSK
jgi:hypothetical protein